MRTTTQWWTETKASATALNAWLLDQYRGEATAAGRIRALVTRFGPHEHGARTLEVIARQEEKHARWVAQLLVARGIEPVVADEAERYWRDPLAAIESFATGCAVGAHAEKMRLERIEEIARDDDAPADVRAVFARILVEERFHERAFRTLAGERAMARTRGAHELGRAALGLSR